MAVTANQLIVMKEGKRLSYPAAASTTFYQGSLAFVNSSGYADDDVASGANKFAGVVIGEVDNSAGSAADLNVECHAEGVFELVGSGFTQGTVGSDIYASDNYTVGTSGSSTTYIGRCVGYISTTNIWVKISVQTEPDNVSAVDLDDDEEVILGTGDDAVILWSTGDASNHALVVAIGDTSQALHITDLGAKDTDWNIAGTTHPNVYIHSNTTPATDYLRLGGHTGTAADIDVVGGTTLNLQIAGTSAVTLTATALTLADELNIVVNSTTGTKIGTATTQKLGFYNATPVVQQSTTGTTTGFTAGSGTAAKDDSTYTGDSGTAAYTVGDVVRALKALGFLAAS